MYDLTWGGGKYGSELCQDCDSWWRFVICLGGGFKEGTCQIFYSHFLFLVFFLWIHLDYFVAVWCHYEYLLISTFSFLLMRETRDYSRVWSQITSQREFQANNPKWWIVSQILLLLYMAIGWTLSSQLVARILSSNFFKWQSIYTFLVRLLNLLWK